MDYFQILCDTFPCSSFKHLKTVFRHKNFTLVQTVFKTTQIENIGMFFVKTNMKPIQKKYA